MTPFADPAVKAHFDTYPPAVRKKMLALRELIFDTAARAEGVGELQETLKWGEPAYLTARPRSGSTVRIDWKPRAPGQYAVYFNCQTGLVDQFRTLFPNDFRFEGSRALVLTLEQRIPEDSLALCIEASLRYHLGKQPQQARP
ncbi:DUF1801 domain-containing protein [Paucibacter sp. XJ19-41]|uniref:DUF1801 domain-containing protein n=1 Tax=Paucibacter sp. XJ19-41 TaxID=2927824 RepID=UPI00234A1A99|nr:DUF1801 domain-containing protein [Paucibacter sp. XJ19-41]MDC6170519.1 DUF1801 domain-containing protein [Paucibacter sp. XJ19-41]